VYIKCHWMGQRWVSARSALLASPLRSRRLPVTIAHHTQDQIKRNRPQMFALIFFYYVYSRSLPSPYLVSCWSPPREQRLDVDVASFKQR
jgi:hypothetical protein